MNYSNEEIIQYLEEEDVKFIRLSFCDVFGTPKNLSIMPSELNRVFQYGASIDSSAFSGFAPSAKSDLFLHPDPSTITFLPWRPEHGKVVKMNCSIKNPDGTNYVCDTSRILKDAVKYAHERGYKFNFGAEMEFYLFKVDDEGNCIGVPYDTAGYMDVAPSDKGENVRREICLTLEKMGIMPESSHHEEGPGQNEIDFRFSDPISAADNATTFKTVVRTVAARHGLYATFSPKPLSNKPGNGYHINISVTNKNNDDLLSGMLGGLCEHILDITPFLNCHEKSADRLGEFKAPRYVTWSEQNRSQLIRVPAAQDMYKRIELRSPDGGANPYLAYALLIYAIVDGIESNIKPPAPTSINLYEADAKTLEGFKTLTTPGQEAVQVLKSSAFLKKILPCELIEAYITKHENL